MRFSRLATLALGAVLLTGTLSAQAAAPKDEEPIPGYGSAASPTTTRKLESMTTPDFIRVQSGERIDCGGGTITYSGKGGILIEDVHDVVIQNCRFESTLAQIPTQIRGKPVVRTESVCKRARIPLDTFGCGVAVYVRGQSYNVAILHNAFTRCGEKCIAVWSEGLARTPEGKAPTPDRITIAYNDFRDTYFGIAIGANAGLEDSALAENERVTFAFNRCDGVFRRCARFASGAKGDETDNVIRRWTLEGPDCGKGRGFGPSTTGGARVQLRANVLDAAGSCPKGVDNTFYGNAAISASGDDRGLGLLRNDPDYPDKLENGAEEDLGRDDQARLEVPPYRVLPATEVEAFVDAHVGPKPEP